MVRILITGITGFVGSRLAKKLLENGEKYYKEQVEIYGLVRYRADEPSYRRLYELRIKDLIRLYYGNVEDLYVILKIIREIEPDIIFHLAAQSYVHLSFKLPHKTFNTNLSGTLNILEAIRLSEIDPIVHFAGSSEEYGLQIISEKQYHALLKKYGVIFPEPKKIPEIPIRENNPLRPQSPYAISKVAADHLMQLYYRAYGIKTIITRAFNHEGAGRGDNFVTSQIAKQITEIKLGLRDHIEIGNINTFRDWSHVEDVIEAYILATKSRKIYGYPINIGSGRTNSVLTYILWSLEKAGYQVQSLKTINDEIVIEEPAAKETIRKFGLEWIGSKVDLLLLNDEIYFDLRHKGILINTDKGPIKVVFSKKRFRPAEVPILLCDYSMAKEKIGWQPQKQLVDIIKEQLDYYFARITTNQST